MNLVEKLRGYTGNIYNEEAADRIEALESELNEYKDAECRAVKLHGEALTRIKELESTIADLRQGRIVNGAMK